MVLVAGIDVGTTTAIVVLDSNKNIVYKISRKNFSEEEIVKIISNLKNVVLLATDKAKIPHSIKKIAARLQLGVFAPRKDIPLEYKKKFYQNKELKLLLDNIHEIDAYIAAYYSLENVLKVIKKAEDNIKDNNLLRVVLRRVFRNNKIEPISALNMILNESKNKKINRMKDNLDIKKTKTMKNNKKNYPKVKIIIKKKSEECIKEKQKIINLNKTILKLYYDIDSIILKIIEGDLRNVAIKYSFLERINKSFTRVFVDKEITNFSVFSKAKEIYYTDEKFISDIISSFRTIKKVVDYEDHHGYIIVKSFEDAPKKNSLDEDIIKERIKKLIREAKYKR